MNSFLKEITLFISILIFLTFLSSCKKQEVEIPSYLQIDQIEIKVKDPLNQGSASSKVIDAWLFIDDEITGIYELPAKIPVLYSDRHQLKIAAGVMQNGVSATRVAYPFYDFYVSYTELIRDSIIQLNPVVSYFEDIAFQWIEDFEDVGISLVPDSRSDTNIIRTLNPSEVYEGNGSGAIFLGESAVRCKVFTSESFVLPKDGSPVYMELDYFNSGVELRVGIVANSPSAVSELPIVVLKPLEKWNKVYVDITPEVNAYIDATDFKMMFFAEIDTNTTNSASIFLDNLKLLHQNR